MLKHLNSRYARHTLPYLLALQKQLIVFLGVATQWKLWTEDYVMGVAHIMN